MLNDSSDSFDEGIGRLEFDPAKFSGVARLFPLPGVSIYPRVVQPLHIYEERYRELMSDALVGDGLIAMAILKPGWEIDYASRPPLEAHACLGKIVAHHRLDDGRYNLMLAGVARVKIIEEIEPPRSFRRAQVELLEEIEPSLDDPSVQELQRQLSAAFRAALPAGEPPEPLQRVFDADTPLGLLADLASYTLPLPHALKRSVLGQPDAVVRAQALLAGLSGDNPQSEDAPPSGFPPPFSLN